MRTVTLIVSHWLALRLVNSLPLSSIYYFEDKRASFNQVAYRILYSQSHTMDEVRVRGFVSSMVVWFVDFTWRKFVRYLCYCFLSPFNVCSLLFSRLPPFWPHLKPVPEQNPSSFPLRTRTPRISLNNVLWLEYIKWDVGQQIGIRMSVITVSALVYADASLAFQYGLPANKSISVNTVTATPGVYLVSLNREVAVTFFWLHFIR